MRNKRIVVLAHYYFELNRAGGEKFLHSICKRLVQEGHEVIVVVTSSGTRTPSTYEGVKIRYLNRQVPLRMFNPDVIISHFQNVPFALRQAKIMNKPLIQIIHNDRQATKNHAMAAHPRDLLVFNTNWIKETTPHRCKSLVVHPPVDKETYSTDQKGEYITLVNVTPEKGSDTFYWLAKNMPDEKFLAVSGGYWKDRQVWEELPNVTFQENTEDMRSIYGKSKIVLMPSVYESYGLVAREAIVSGTPVIAHPTPGLKENLGKAGIFVDRNDLEGYKKEIEKLNNQEYYKKHSELVKEWFNETESEDQLNQLVQTLKEL